MSEQLYRYTVLVCEFYDAGSHEIEVTNKVLDEKGNELWYHTPEEALNKRDELDMDNPDNVYSVEVDYYVDPYER
jgi:hypothetical protein